MRNKIILLMLLSIITAFSYQESYEVLAHFDEIDVTSDECVPINYVDENNIGDGIHEKWYRIIPSEISDDTYTCHIDYVTGSTPKIKYYYEQNAKNDNSYNWNCVFSNNEEINFKNDFSNSIKKWNNIYIYRNENQLSSKHKLIDVCEGDENDHNLIIYPVQNVTYAAATYDVGEGNLIFDQPYDHFHYEKREIHVNISHFIGLGQIQKSTLIEHTGAHEFGHVLGLDDLEECNQSQTYHHEEAIMGYSNNAYGYSLCKNISYKDIAGAMITMGFHTANDHKWLYDVNGYTGSVVENEYKLICSICNGVKYVSSLTDIGYDVYRECDNNHSLSSGKMMPVASYGNKDYIKCKYCRYVAPFEERVQQEYIYTKKNSTIHTITNDVEGLTYTFEEKHGDYSYSVSNKSGKHLKRCGGCNYIIEEPHAVSLEDYMDGNNTVTCRGCNRTFDKNSGQFVINNINELQRTENGSYILPNGIIILVEEDIQAYLDGTLVFRDGNSEIM